MGGFHSSTSEYITTLQYRLQAANRQLEGFKNGTIYQKQDKEIKELIRSGNRKQIEYENELSKAHSETVTVRKYWSEVMDDLDKEHRQEISQKDRLIKKLENEKMDALRKLDASMDKYKAKNRECYELAAENEELKEQIKKLKSKINKDFENSSIPSSMQGLSRKKIPNGREKTGRKPGGQPGHLGHGRKKHVADEEVLLPPPPEFTEDNNIYPTGAYITKQVVSLEIRLHVCNYMAEVYRSRINGSKMHAPFPPGVVNEVNYDGSIKALAYLLRNECNVSIDKTIQLLNELTGGKLDLSEGLINNLCSEFSKKTGREKKEIINAIMSAPVMNVDFTNANVNESSAQVLVMASAADRTALYAAREHKGHQGIKGTPVEVYGGTLVHDHDRTFYNYGTNHQECTQHDIRYLKGSIENEKGLTWNTAMLELFREMIHYHNGLRGEAAEPEVVAMLEQKYDTILETARKEYEYEPPSDYYREGYNLYKRLEEYKENELLFLHDKNVPSNNSLCERLARQYKRKQKQAIVIRSPEALSDICNGLSVIHLLRQKSSNVYQDIIKIFGR